MEQMQMCLTLNRCLCLSDWPGRIFTYMCQW